MLIAIARICALNDAALGTDIRVLNDLAIGCFVYIYLQDLQNETLGCFKSPKIDLDVSYIQVSQWRFWRYCLILHPLMCLQLEAHGDK